LQSRGLAVRLDTEHGATPWQRFTRITLPLMKPAILVALLFRTLDAFPIFDNIFVLTSGNNGTASVSALGYDNLFNALHLGIGSTIALLIFICVALIAAALIPVAWLLSLSFKARHRPGKSPPGWRRRPTGGYAGPPAGFRQRVQVRAPHRAHAMPLGGQLRARLRLLEFRLQPPQVRQATTAKASPVSRARRCPRPWPRRR
jgi:hypothetical protein